MKSNILIILVLVFSRAVFSLENPNHNQQNILVKKDESYWSKIKFMAELNVKTYNTDYVEQSDNDDGTNSILTHNIGIALPLISNFSITTNYTFIKTDMSSKKETNRDQDIQDASGHDIRLVERKLSYEYKEKPGFEFNLEYDIKISPSFFITPYIGYSATKGSVLAERYDMTDRDNPLFFSKHNRYTLTSTSEFKKRNIHFGTKFYFLKHMFGSIALSLSKTTFSNTNRNITTNGETISFNDDSFYFEKYKDGQSISDRSIALGFGVYF